MRVLVKKLSCFAGALTVGAVLAMSQTTAQAPNAKTNTGQFSPDALGANQLQLGLGFSTSYDDNAFNAVNGTSQTLFSPRPSVEWNIARSHWSSQLAYDALIQRSSKFDFYNQTSHALNTTFTHELNKSLSFVIKDTFVRSVDPLFSTESVPIGGPQNPAFFGQPALRTSNMSDLEVDYRLDAHNSLTFGGNYYFQRYSDVPQASQRDSNDAAGRASFQHATSARMTVGTSYDYTKITTPAGISTVSQRISLTDDYAFNPSMNLSVFVGPNHVSSNFAFVQNGNLGLISNAGWSWSAGGTYTWIMTKMTMVGSAIREVNNGGGLVGTVQMTSFQYRIQGHLPHKLNGSIYAGYSINHELIPQTGTSLSPHYGTAGGSIGRAIGRQVVVSLAYDRAEQMVPGEYPGNPWIDRNRVTASINYQFTHPLGR